MTGKTGHLELGEKFVGGSGLDVIGVSSFCHSQDVVNVDLL